MPMLLPEVFALSADRAACRALIRSGSRSFFAASRLLPVEVREGAIALYAFCRLADDAIDGQGAAVGDVATLRRRLELAYAGQPLPLAADRALAETVRQFAVPRELPEALLEGLAWDAAGRRFEDLEQVTAYAVRVAGSVGAMMACLMGMRSAAAIARACDLGVAMQLTNIARDVGEDARAGRLYLPLAWLREAGIDPQRWLERPQFSTAVGRVVARLLAHADGLYARAATGIALLPRDCRASIRAARLIYAEIGRELARSGLNSVDARAVVSTRRKLLLIGRALLGSTAAASERDAPALPQAQYLVDAVTRLNAAAERADRGEALGGPVDRITWIVALFERLEQADREHTLSRGLRATSS